MIHVPAKTFQLVFWLDTDRHGQALRLDFDDLEEARRVLTDKEAEGRYGAGILVEWNKRLKDWTLLAQYPDRP